jgi:hypothetical protein
MRQFEVARSRLQRATDHFASAAAQWNTLPIEDLYKVSLKVDPGGNGTIKVAKNKPAPMENSLLLGEALYHLRSALDACVYQASAYASGKNPPPDENKLEFPICSDCNEFPKLAKRRLFALPKDLQELMERMQPYNTPALPPQDLIRSVNRTLGILNDLARKDRHRTLHVVGSWVTNVQPEFDLPKGVRVTMLTRTMGGFLGDWSDVATFKLVGFRRDMIVQANPHLTTAMALDEPPPPCHENDTWAQRLTQMLETVGFVIGEFENYF